MESLDEIYGALYPWACRPCGRIFGTILAASTPMAYSEVREATTPGLDDVCDRCGAQLLQVPLERPIRIEGPVSEFFSPQRSASILRLIGQAPPEDLSDTAWRDLFYAISDRLGSIYDVAKEQGGAKAAVVACVTVLAVFLTAGVASAGATVGSQLVNNLFDEPDN